MPMLDRENNRYVVDHLEDDYIRKAAEQRAANLALRSRTLDRWETLRSVVYRLESLLQLLKKLGP